MANSSNTTSNSNINNYLFSDFPSLSLSSSSSLSPHQNPRKRKRTRFPRMSAAGLLTAKPKPKKPDPSAPKMTDPCSECGRRFDSDKALYGHMRCHPERPWRGIKRPPFLRRLPAAAEDSDEEDHEVAVCLLMLANGPPAPTLTPTPAYDSDTTACTVSQPTPEYSESDHNMGRFECSSCKKVFGSHQALGGHRASHKNVKGCYAIMKNEGEEEAGCCSGGGGDMMMMMMLKDNCNGNSFNVSGHKCSICFRVFSSGQALGGHMRCHWEKAEEEAPSSSRACEFDLNLAAAPPSSDDDASSLQYAGGGGGLALDLRLGF